MSYTSQSPARDGARQQFHHVLAADTATPKTTQVGIAHWLPTAKPRSPHKLVETGGTRRNVIDLTGKRFGRLVVLSYAGHSMRLCACDCGGRAIVRGQSLRSGKTQSCGCLSRLVATKHGMVGTSEYTAWQQLKLRCLNPQHAAYENYGGRGISVCERWLNSFAAFSADMGRKPSPEHSIDRTDNDGNYEPGNCRWATATQQLQNRRPSTKAVDEQQTFFDLGGEEWWI